MLDLLWLLLPVAAASGWIAARRVSKKASIKQTSPFLANRYIRGLNYLLNEQQDKALEVFIEMIEVDSETVETHLVLGNLFRRRGEVDRAIRIHQNLIARPQLERQHKIQALLELGKDYTKAGLLDRAEGVFRELISLGSDTAEPYKLLRSIYEKEQEWLRAIEVTEKYEKYSRESQSALISQYFCELAQQDLWQSNLTNALANAKKAMSLDKSNVRPSLILSECEKSRGEYKKALGHLMDVLEINPEFFTVVHTRALDIEQAAGDGIGLAKFYEQASKYCDGPSLVRARVDCLIKNQQIDKARSLLDEVFAQRKFTPELMQRYASILERQNTHALPKALTNAIDTMSQVAQDEYLYRCSHCGFKAMSLFWQCPSCHGWTTVQPVDEWMKQN
jgi:lipopolysaccharide biosynthesis regulator YciM